MLLYMGAYAKTNKSLFKFESCLKLERCLNSGLKVASGYGSISEFYSIRGIDGTRI